MRIATVIVGTLALSFAASAADPFVGTWKLDPERSGISDGRSLKYEAIPNGYRIAHSRPSEASTDETLILDGKDHPAAGLRIVVNTGADAYSARRIDDHTLEVLYKRGGKTLVTQRREVSALGRVLSNGGEALSKDGQKVQYRPIVFNKQ